MRSSILFWQQKYDSRSKLFITQRRNRSVRLALKNLDSLLKMAPFIVEMDSMSVKHIRTLKTMKGVYVCWSEIIDEFTFAVIHAKVVVEDCISREP